MAADRRPSPSSPAAADGRPAFDAGLGPELEAAMAEHRAEVEAIADGPWPPAFEDTIAALERAGQRLHVAERVFGDASSARSTPEIRALEAEMLPRLAAHHDAIGLDPRVFARIADLAARRGELALDAEQDAVLDRYHRDVVRAGATLDAGRKARLRAINERLSTLGATYRANLREDTAALAVQVDDPASLDGLPVPLVEAAARAAREDGVDGHVLRLALTSAQPVLEHLHDRALRERVWRASIVRCRRGGPHDNRGVVAETVALRAERAGLLGFDSHAELELAEQTAGSVAAVMDLLEEVGAAAAASARAEGGRHEAALRADGHPGPLEPWDWPYYAARERRRRHAVDEGRLPAYFALDAVVRDGLFALASDLYGLTFTPRDDLPRPHPDVRVWSVADADGAERGELYVDAFAREGKSGGAWMDAYAEPAPLVGRRPRVVIVLNATPPADGAPALLTPLDVRILFHEFGHALHMLLSDVRYPRVAGLNVPSDVVEFPSKLHEALAFHPDVLARYARHHETGEPPTAAEAAALGAYERDSAAFNSTRGAASSLVDQAWHALAPGAAVAPEDVDAFEDAVLERHRIALHAVGSNLRSTFFPHVFAGSYPGTHYSYLWSAMLEAAMRQWMDDEGGPTRAVGQRLRDEFLSRGAVVDPLAALRAITGREPAVRPMLELRGLV
jgi:peptidyl-dipeptidase Dcp